MAGDTTSYTAPALKRLTSLFVVLLIVGSVAYFSLRDHWSFYAFSHLGAIGVMGLLGVAAAFIASKKRRDYWRAFLLGFALPILLGVAAVFLVRFAGGTGTPFYCGGSVSLLAAVLVVLGYLSAGKRL